MPQLNRTCTSTGVLEHPMRICQCAGCVVVQDDSVISAATITQERYSSAYLGAMHQYALPYIARPERLCGSILPSCLTTHAPMLCAACAAGQDDSAHLHFLVSLFGSPAPVCHASYSAGNPKKLLASILRGHSAHVLVISFTESQSRLAQLACWACENTTWDSPVMQLGSAPASAMPHCPCASVLR